MISPATQVDNTDFHLPLPQPARDDLDPLATTTRRRSILLAEDDDAFRALLATALRHAGYDVFECGDGTHLLDAMTSTLLDGRPRPFDLVISDVRMPGTDGLQVLECTNGFVERPPMILITAFGSERIHRKARELGARVMLDKPFEIEDLVREVDSLLKPAR